MNPLPKYFFYAALTVGVVTCPTIAFDLGFGSASSDSEIIEQDEFRPRPISELKKISAQLDNWKLEGARSIKTERAEEVLENDSKDIEEDQKIEKVDSILYRYVMSKFVKGMVSKY